MLGQVEHLEPGERAVASNGKIYPILHLRQPRSDRSKLMETVLFHLRRFLQLLPVPDIGGRRQLV